MTSKQKRAPRHVRLLPEWLGQTGLWLRDERDGSFDAVDAEDIGLSDEIAERLETFMDEFDSIFDDRDPMASRFASRSAFAAWRAEGEAIASAIRAELEPEDRLDVLLPNDLGPHDH